MAQKNVKGFIGSIIVGEDRLVVAWRNEIGEIQKSYATDVPPEEGYFGFQPGLQTGDTVLVEFDNDRRPIIREAIVDFLIAGTQITGHATCYDITGEFEVVIQGTDGKFREIPAACDASLQSKLQKDGVWNDGQALSERQVAIEVRSIRPRLDLVITGIVNENTLALV